MYIAIRTHDVWLIDAELSASRFFIALGSIVSVGDILALGAYEPSHRSIAELEALGAVQRDISTIYHGAFEINRREHPNGRSFEVEVDRTVLSRLAKMSDWEDGQKDKPLFFDHVLAYRRGMPTLPLFCYHDAFFGGSLYLSGLFEEEAIKAFAMDLGVTYAREFNPEFRIQEA